MLPFSLVLPFAAAAAASESFSHKLSAILLLVEKLLLRVQRLVKVTLTVKLVEPLPMFLALSVAVAEKVLLARAKE